MPSGTIGSATGANNVTGVAADYTSIANWHANIDGNNQTGTIIRISAAVDTSNVTLNDTHTGLLVTAHTDAALNAATSSAASGRARISGAIIDVQGSGFTLEKFSVVAQPTSTRNTNSVDLTLRRMAFDGGTLGGSSDQEGWRSTGGTTNLTVSNCSFFGYTDSSGRCCLSLGNINFYHCSFLAAGETGVYQLVGTVNAYACIAQGSGVCFRNTVGGDYNVSEDATAPGSASTKYARSTSGWFTGTGDFSLVAGKQGWWAANKDAIDQTGWPSDVGTDIVGTTRAAPIDPGVWQTPAAGGGGMLRRFAWLGGLGKPISSLTGGLHG